MTNTTLAGWEPPAAPPTYYEPVQDESAAAGLTACSLPDGRAVALWPLGTEVRFAVVPSMATLLGNDTVPSADIATALTAGHAVNRTTVFTTGGEVYFVVLGSTAFQLDMFWIRVYKADDPLDPYAGWSLQGTVQAGTLYNFTDFGGTVNVGHPIILASGRWVLTAADAYRSTSFGGFVGRDASIWYSDDDGATWTGPVVTYFHGSPAHHAHHSPTQIVQHPSSGLLITTRVLDPNNTDTITSSDDGATWTNPGYTNDDKSFQPFLDNGTDVFAVQCNIATGYAFRLTGTAWVQETQVWDPGAGIGNFNVAGQDGEAVKFIVDNGALWYFVGPYVGAPATGWWINRIPMT